ncbi:hypothetical protein CSIM01_06669 [Colletotrichum simmondsii]|uniref:Uncharacterized protein n=1 Tax=Colletotrichum simmondsii TaxID=703756 RepID=A0A135SUM5_9PEZI|nr:hypothetical protein CSIM01_06669 [Colletotrichum simmondsii]
MSTNATPADIAASREMDHNTTSQPGPSTGSASGNPVADTTQGVSQGDAHGGGKEEKKAMDFQRLHAAIQEERRANIEEIQRQKAKDQAEMEEKERLQKAVQAQAAKDREQKARLDRAIQASPEELAAYEESLQSSQSATRRERNHANTIGRINAYLERQGKKRR